MKLMHENSLFAILLRARWWLSLVVALGLFALLRLAVKEAYAVVVALPFVVIAAIAGWRQLRAPSDAKVAARLERLRALSWEEFSAALEAGLKREGYGVARLAGGEADFELTREGRLALLACRRWKAARTGVEPLRELHAAGAAREIAECLYVCAGELSAQARAFAAEKRIRLVEGAELARLAG